MNNFIKRSFDFSGNWSVYEDQTGYAYDQDGVTTPVIRFNVQHREIPLAGRTVTVSVERSVEDHSSEGHLQAVCECSEYYRSGLPCAHITRLLLSFEDQRLLKPQWRIHLGLEHPLELQITKHVHCYWQRYNTEWKASLPMCRVQRSTSRNGGNEQELDLTEERVRFETVRLASDCNTMNLFRQCQVLATH